MKNKKTKTKTNNHVKISFKGSRRQNEEQKTKRNEYICVYVCVV